jgi:hypothetical protein
MNKVWNKPISFGQQYDMIKHFLTAILESKLKRNGIVHFRTQDGSYVSSYFLWRSWR